MIWIPGWNSVAGAGWWSNFYFWFGIACLFLLGASEVASHYYGVRKDKLVSIAEASCSQQQEATDRAKEARRKTEAEAFQRSLSEAAQQADNLQKEVKEAEASRSTETAQLRKQLTEADKKVAELERLREPRHMTDDQKGKLIEFLRNEPKGQFIIKASMATNDARAYAEEIAAFFRDRLGWSVRIDNAMFGGSDVNGLWITIKNSNAIPPSTAALHNGFEYAELPMRHIISVDSGVPTEEEIWLSIGSKN